MMFGFSSRRSRHRTVLADLNFWRTQALFVLSKETGAVRCAAKWRAMNRRPVGALA